MLQELSSAESIAAQEANLAAFWSAYGLAPGRDLTRADGLVRVTTRLPDALMNGIFFSQLTPANADQLIAATRDYYTAQRQPMLWWVGPSAQPDDLGARLVQTGFTRVNDIPMMAVDLRSLSQEPTPPDVTIKQVESDDELRAWSRIITDSFGLETSSEELAELERDLGLERDGIRPRFIAYLHDQPVATSSLYLDSGVAGIYTVATLPTARGRGIGAAITLAPLLHARALGYQVGTLQATAMGQPVYHRLGFQDIAPFEIYAWSGGQG